MLFAKRLREGVRRGEITCTVRIWTRPHVKAGHRYRMEEGEVEVDSIEPIGLPDITPELARASGFLGVLDLLKMAQHGRGDKIYLIRFHYIPGSDARPDAWTAAPQPAAGVAATIVRRSRRATKASMIRSRRMGTFQGSRRGPLVSPMHASRSCRVRPPDSPGALG